MNKWKTSTKKFQEKGLISQSFPLNSCEFPLTKLSKQYVHSAGDISGDGYNAIIVNYSLTRHILYPCHTSFANLEFISKAYKKLHRIDNMKIPKQYRPQFLPPCRPSCAPEPCPGLAAPCLRTVANSQRLSSSLGYCSPYSSPAATRICTKATRMCCCSQTDYTSETVLS